MQISGMRRFYSNSIINGDTAVISGQEADHITRVLRMQSGDDVLLFDGTGMEYTAKIVALGKEGVQLQILNRAESSTELGVDIVLCQAVIKHDHFEYAVQKCTELGVKRILPFFSERCVKKPKSRERFLERANRTALEAVKQCGRSFVPVVEDILEFPQLVERVQNHNVLFAYECERQTSLKQVLSRCAEKEFYVIVGPEGGFSPSEAEQLQQAGAISVSLGKLILRAETAGVAAIAMISYECGGQQ